jgi:hypothetical protein
MIAFHSHAVLIDPLNGGAGLMRLSPLLSDIRRILLSNAAAFEQIDLETKRR